MERNPAVHGRDGAAPTPTIRVMALPAFFNRRLNPYNFLLYSAMRRRGATVEEVTPTRVVRARHDVVHLHWPEYSFTGRWILVAAAKAAVLVLALTRLRRRRVRIVWTIHNLSGHEARHRRLEAKMWNWFVARVDGYIALSASGRAAALARFPVLADRPGFVIPHGHYRGEYPDELDRVGARERLGIPAGARVVAFVGSIRPYKNVPALIRAVRAIPGREWRLLVAGEPATSAIAAELTDAAAGDERIRLDLAFVQRQDVQVYLRAADLVVLPYAEVLNSGSALLALSFERPVLVPERGALADLQAAVGAEWVRTYAGDLRAQTVIDAMAWAEETPRDAARLLHDLDWDDIARQTLLAYDAVRDLLVTAPAPSQTSAGVPAGR